LTRQEKKRIIKQEPYRWQQMKNRVAAHKVIKDRIAEEKAAKQGDPIRGFPTPYIESFATAGQAEFSTPATDDYGTPLEEPHPLPTSPHLINHLASREELDAAVARAYALTKPEDYDAKVMDPEEHQEKMAEHERAHSVAVEAINRIVDLSNGNAKDRRHANIRRIIDTFGRHNTDGKLRQKPLSMGVVEAPKPVRAGPDTGSSEVQIAILTAKINRMADQLAINRGHRDKMGKRNMRLLVHRRQRLLRYMERKERGSERWTNLLETLGLSPATWKGQITVG
jgi:ribosomal protein S15